MVTTGRRRSDVQGGAAPPLRALIVDDAEHYRKYAATLLRRLGFSVTTASDGAEAMQLVAAGAFDLLVIDCEMPRMGGLELIEFVRTSEHCAESFALMLTGREDVETKIQALRLGFDDFVVKSMPDVEIVAKIGAARRLVARQRRLDAAVRELYGLATRDELTGLFNRRFFFTEAERRMAERQAIGIVLFDLDDFKHVNDTYGHLAGDRILRDVGALFLKRTRHEDLIARYGGDEFVMLVASAIPAEVERMAQRIVDEASSMQWTIGSDTFRVGMTFGYAASVLLEEPSLEQLLTAGDRDLYKNKWLRANPDRDPAVYEYDQRGGRISDLLEFRAAQSERERKQQSD